MATCFDSTQTHINCTCDIVDAHNSICAAQGRHPPTKKKKQQVEDNKYEDACNDVRKEVEEELKNRYGEEKDGQQLTSATIIKMEYGWFFNPIAAR